jgi:hypothetical protein
MYRCEGMFTEPFPSNRSLLLRLGPHRKHFYCVVDHLCMLDCLQSCVDRNSYNILPAGEINENNNNIKIMQMVGPNR